MRAVVVHGAGDLRVDERPDPMPGDGEVLIAMEWGGVCGSDLSYWRHGGLRHRRAAPSPGARPRGGRADRRGSAPVSAGTRWGSRSPSTRPSWSGTGACPIGSPAAPTSTRGSATSARRRSTRTPTAGSANCGWSAPPRSARCPTGSAPSTARWPSPSPSPCTQYTGPATYGVATCSSTGRARSARWWSPRPSTAARPASWPPDIADSSLAVAKAMGADELRNLAAGDTLPEDAELVFEASGAPAALGERTARDRPRRHARPGRQPARDRRSPPSSVTWSPGRSPGSGRTGSSRRSATPWPPCATGSTCRR